MKARVFFPGRARNYARTLNFLDAAPDDFSLVSALVENIRTRSGPLWNKLRLPEEIISQPDPLFANMVISIEERIYLVLPDGTALQPLHPEDDFAPSIDPEI